MGRLPQDYWPQLSSALVYPDPRAAIAWLVDAMGFEVKIIVDAEDGGVQHSELLYGAALVMVMGERESFQTRFRTPAHAGGNTQTLQLYVEDVGAHHDRALAHGARIATPLAEQDYGPGYWVDRSYSLIDPGGHLWWIAERLRTD